MAEHADLSLGELDRNIGKLTTAVDRLSSKIDGLDEIYVTRREWELANAAVKVDIHNVAETGREIQESLRWIRRASWGGFFSFCAIVLGGVALVLIR